MTGRAALTTGYLGEVARHRLTAGDLLSVMPSTGLLATGSGGRYLSRPLFLGQAESEQLNADLQHIRAALVSLPARLFGGDVAAFARAVGMTGAQVAAVRRGQAGNVTQLARADMYPQRDGLRLLEFNMGSAVDGIENADMCRAMLRHPLLRDFAGAHGLRYADTFSEHLGMIFEETGFGRDSFPMVAVVDWPEHYLRIRGFLHAVTRRWRTLGLDAHACHIGQLKARNGRVWLRGRPVDIVFRIFLIEHLLEPGGPGLMNPVLDAAARGEVAMFTPLDSELYGSKAPLAMLSDHANRHLFTAGQLAAFDRVLPWTRMVRPGPVTLEDGSAADLLDYAVAQQHDLVLKPTLLHGGLGILPGWHRTTTPRIWRDQLALAARGGYVLQRRIRPVAELCPGPDGRPARWIVTWGVFTFPAGYGGVFARAFPASTRVAVLRAGSGPALGCCLVGQP